MKKNAFFFLILIVLSVISSSFWLPSDTQNAYVQVSNSKLFCQSMGKGDPKIMAHYLKIIFRTYCALPENADRLNLLMPREANLNFIQTGAIFNQTLFSNFFDLENDLQKLSCKILVVHEDKDPIPLSTIQTLHEKMKNSRLVVIEDCSHFPYVEKT